MGASSTLPVYDHVVMDSKGIRGVKDGKEFPISEEDWKKAHPEHRNTECKECTFVQDMATLLAFMVPKEVREMATEEPKDCGVFTMPGWSGHSHFYLFKCKACRKVVVDYPHGYHGEYWYLRCGECAFALDLSSSKFRSIYEDNNGFVPKFREEIAGWIKRNFLRLVTRT